MENIYAFYQNNIEGYTHRVNNLKKKIHLAGTIRLFLVAGLIAAVWLLKSAEWTIILAAIVVFLIPFLSLMIYHSFLSDKRSYAEEFVSFCRKELKALDYDFSAFDGAPEKINGEHSFSLDLDLFGERSFFQSINRTVTYKGKDLLSKWFLQPLTNKPAILKRQEAIKELSVLSQMRIHFYVTGKLQPGKKSDPDVLAHVSRTGSGLDKSLFWKIAVILVPAVWVLLFTALAMEWINYVPLSLFFTISLILAYLKIKDVNQIHETVNRMEKIFQTYARLIRILEDEDFKSEELAEVCRSFGTGKHSASREIKRFSKLIGTLDQRGSGGGIILNIFTLRDTRTAIALEQWRKKHAVEMQQWLEMLARFDALSSLAGFGFNHPEYIYPQIAETYFEMKGKGIGHPLIPRDTCVSNDISIEKNPFFLIVTGANMAGKSTYLRTIGINFLLAAMGAPVCAQELSVYPARLVTSLRTSDSLVSNESYFFAELKRLKMIIDRLKQGEELFIILDEILKGTNSVDKQKGSLALIKQLIRYNTCGIIATHDLVLGKLAEEFPGMVKNYRFEADITDNELTFTYQLREGVAQNMNACFLMNKMGITV